MDDAYTVIDTYKYDFPVDHYSREYMWAVYYRNYLGQTRSAYVTAKDELGMFVKAGKELNRLKARTDKRREARKARNQEGAS